MPLSPIILAEFDSFTHVLLTSPNAARILISRFSLQNKRVLTIGKGTAEALQKGGIPCFSVASQETQEGMIELLKSLPLQGTYLFYPRSSSARPLLGAYLEERGWKHQTCDLYETVFLKPDPLPSLRDFDEIVFTSPSTLRAFLALYKALPSDKKLHCIGPVTQAFLNQQLKSH